MATDFSGIADDFFVNLNLQTALPLPDSRETILHFCEAAQKEFPAMTAFYQKEGGEFVLEGDRDAGSYSWMELHSNRLTGGYFNPPDGESAYRMHRWLLDRCVYFLGISGLDVECLDLLFGFNLDYPGNRDAIVAQALLAGSPLAGLMFEAGGACLECEPNLVVALDENCYRQGRLSIETRGDSYQVRTGQYSDDPISVYFTVRDYPRAGKVFDPAGSFNQQAKAIEEITSRVIIPQIIEPIAAAIATAG